MTGSGKSACAEAIARRRPVRLINLDPFQSYRQLRIGTASPAPEVADLYRMVACYDPDQVLDAVQYAAAVRREIAAAQGAGKVPLLVGGSGFYLRALTAPLDPLVVDPEATARAQALVRNDPLAALQELQRLDRAAASGLAAADHYRITKALLRVRRPPAPTPVEPLPVAQFGLWGEGGHYERRLRVRIDRMLAQGWWQEAEEVAERWGREAPALRALGYRELITAAADAPVAILRETRRYAKRQRTWFRREPVRWYPLAGADRLEAALIQYMDGTFCRSSASDTGDSACS